MPTAPLDDLQLSILRSVVGRFLRSWEPSPRKTLVIEFEDPDALDALTRWALLRSFDNIAFFPGVLSFHYCGDPEAESLAKKSISTVARILRKKYREDNPDLGADALTRAAREFYDGPDAALVLKLGLYFAPSFNLLTAWSGGTADVMPNAINERVIKLKDRDIDELWEKYVRENIPWPVQDSFGGVTPPQGIFRAPHEMFDAEELSAFQADARTSSRKVFVVHGHDNGAKEEVARFLEKLRLEVVILHEQPNMSLTIIEKFETHSEDVAFAIVLLTPDDVGGERARQVPPESVLKARARQNVVFEFGYFVAKLTRRRVCALYVDGVELPSDMEGVLYVRYEQSGAWRMELAKEISAAGIEVDLNLLY